MMHYRQDHNNQPFRQKGLSLRTVADENSKYDITFYMFPFFYIKNRKSFCFSDLNNYSVDKCLFTLNLN